MNIVQIYFHNHLIEAIEQDDHYVLGALKISKDDAILIDTTDPWKNFTGSVSLKDVHRLVKYVVQDEDGQIKFYKDFPFNASDMWRSREGVFDTVEPYAEANPNWRKAFTTVEAIRQFEASKAPEVRHDPNAFKVGDVVRVVRKAEDFEGGWNAYWASSMDEFVGNEYEITKNVPGHGYALNDKWRFPSFVLELVEPSYKLSDLRKMTLQQIADLIAKGE